VSSSTSLSEDIGLDGVDISPTKAFGVMAASVVVLRKPAARLPGPLAPELIAELVAAPP
jgi:hypothetical protein